MDGYSERESSIVDGLWSGLPAHPLSLSLSPLVGLSRHTSQGVVWCHFEGDWAATGG